MVFFPARDESCGVERPHRAFAARKGASLITVERHGASERCVIRELHGEEIGTGAAHPPNLDLGAGDPARHLEAFPAGLRPSDGARQRGDLLGKGGVKARGAAQAVPDGVARGARLAFGRARAAAAPAVAAARLASRFADHAG